MELSNKNSRDDVTEESNSLADVTKTPAQLRTLIIVAIFW